MPAIDAAAFRELMGRFATGVTVITVAEDERYHGMTANAVTSVSLDPILLLVCVDKTTHTHGMLSRSGRFAVNILAADQERVSRLFAQKMDPEVRSLRGERFHLAASGSPVLSEALAYLDCRVTSAYEGGDHTIFVGEVVDGATLRDAPPLIFYRGGYRALAEA
ncbi:MAG: flavin reductase family protein [Dehalococcoidia bacterium]|nr:flavin reductase family protein [Dehalococcoidia bacterium]